MEKPRQRSSSRRFFVCIAIGFALLLIGLSVALIVVRNQLISRKQRLNEVAKQQGITLSWGERIPWGRPYDRHLKPMHDIVSDYFHEVVHVHDSDKIKDLPASFLDDLNHYSHLDKFKWYTSRHSAEIARLLSHQQNLGTLVFYTKNIQDCDLEPIQRFSSLTNLEIDGLESKHLTGRFLRALVGQTPLLEKLQLYNINLDDEACDAIGNLTSVQSLDLGGSQFTSDSVKTFAKLSALKHLVVDQTIFDERFTTAIGSLSALTTLHAPGSSLTSESANSLAKLSGLKELDVAKTAVDDRFGVTLGALSNLEDLNVTGTALTSKGLQDLEHCRALERLETGGKSGGPQLLAHLRHCLRLRDADIVWTGSFSESDLASFNALPDLTYLYFADIGDSEASHLLQCEHMIGLDIRSNRLTLDGIRSLMQMPDLHFLALAGKVWGPELVDVLYESPTLEHVRILDRIWEWWEFEDLRKRLRTQ